MIDSTRRNFLWQSAVGIAGLGSAGLVLSACAQPTVAVVSGEEANRVWIQLGTIPKDSMPAKGELKPISPLPYGPFYLQELLIDRRTLAPWIRQDLMQRYVAEHVAGQAGHGNRLWPLLVLALWVRRFGIAL